MTPPWKRLGARAVAGLVLLPLLLGVGLGARGLPWAVVLFLGLVLGSMPWVWGAALGVPLCALGPRQSGRALRFALVGRRAQDTPEALEQVSAALALAGRAALSMGLLWWAAETLSSLAYIDAVMRGAPAADHAPQHMARGVTKQLLPPLGALVVGHLWLGQAAEAARRASGCASTAPMLGPWAGAAALLYLAVPVQLLLSMFARFS